MVNPMQENATSPLSSVAAKADDVINLSALLAVLLRYKLQIIGFTVAVTLIAILITFSLTPIYQSTTTLLIQQEDRWI